MNDKTSIRRRIESLEGVWGTRFEWEGVDRSPAKILVVEVAFDTDPNAVDFRGETIEAIGATFKEVLQEGLQADDRRPVIIAGIRIVPARS
jgi:hypothetical protein